MGSGLLPDFDNPAAPPPPRLGYLEPCRVERHHDVDDDRLTTNVAADSRVDYGTTTAYGTSAADPALVASTARR
jgi:hypothetical protein